MDGCLSQATRLGGISRTFAYPIDPFIPQESMQYAMLFDDNASNFTKIYCSCGRIVNIDRKSCSVKRKLHKTIECAVCRNLRIGRELDLLDEHYSVPEQSVYD